MELKPGVSAYEKYGLEPPSPLPLNATTKTPQMLRGIRNIVRLSEWFADREDNIEPDIRGISDSTGTLPTFLKEAQASFKQRLHGFGGCVDWSETKIYDLVLFRYSIEFYDASISTADCMYVIPCALSRVR